eukprot:5964373-Pyramimonas_sp.AAC.1
MRDPRRATFTRALPSARRFSCASTRAGPYFLPRSVFASFTVSPEVDYVTRVPQLINPTPSVFSTSSSFSALAL